MHDDALIANRVVIHCQHNLSIRANVSTDTLQCHKEVTGKVSISLCIYILKSVI